MAYNKVNKYRFYKNVRDIVQKHYIKGVTEAFCCLKLYLCICDGRVPHNFEPRGIRSIKAPFL